MGLALATSPQLIQDSATHLAVTPQPALGEDE